MQVLFADDGLMERKVYLSTWKDIPSTNEVQSTVSGINISLGRVCYILYVCQVVELFDEHV